LHNKNQYSFHKYRKRRYKVNNMIKYAKEKFFENIDIYLDKNKNNPKT